MLSDQEKLLLSDFLNIIDDARLKKIASAVTNGRANDNLLRNCSREECFKWILLYSKSLSCVFNLKRVSSTVLLNYLCLKNVSVPGDSPKDMLVLKVFDLWKVPYSSSIDSYGQVSVSQIGATNTVPVNSFDRMVCPSPTMQPCSISSVSTRQETGSSAYNSLKEMLHTEKMLKEANAIAFDDFVRQFASIYYSLLNKPDPAACYQHGLNASHFFEKCDMLIKIKGDVEECEVIGDSRESVLKNLSDLQKQHQLLFSPNLSDEGVRGKKNWDGLIYAMVCGTLHHRVGVVGHFKQTFVLSNDPYAQNSYKIKDSTLILVSSKAVPSHTQQMLMGSSEESNHLAIEAPQLQITDIS